MKRILIITLKKDDQIETFNKYTDAAKFLNCSTTKLKAYAGHINIDGWRINIKIKKVRNTGLSYVKESGRDILYYS